MQLSESFHMLRMEFEIPISPRESISRFTNIGIICGERVILLDAGVRNSILPVKDYLEGLGKTTADIEWLMITHAHPDHIGGALSFKEVSHCNVAASRYEKDFIENINLQAEARPVPGFHKLVEGSCPVDVELMDDSQIHLGPQDVRVIGTSGHSRGHLAYFYHNDGVLFSGDSLPVPGGMPIYENIFASIEAIQTLRQLEGVNYLITSWEEKVFQGKEVLQRIDASLRWLKKIHQTIIQQHGKSSDIPTIAKGVINELGLPSYAFNPLFFTTIQAHLNIARSDDLLQIA